MLDWKKIKTHKLDRSQRPMGIASAKVVQMRAEAKSYLDYAECSRPSLTSRGSNKIWTDQEKSKKSYKKNAILWIWTYNITSKDGKIPGCLWQHETESHGIVQDFIELCNEWPKTENKSVTSRYCIISTDIMMFFHPIFQIFSFFQQSKYGYFNSLCARIIGVFICLD